MKHKAKRPFKLDFSSQGETHTELFTLELDANDIYEWKVGDIVPEIGASIFQLEFYGLDFATGSKSLLGTVLFDSCDWGLEIYKVVSSAWYEATHPWLDYQDAIKKQVLPHNEECLVMKQDDGHIWHEVIAGHHLKGVNNSVINAFKPLKPFEYAYFNNVEVWQA